MSLDLSLLDRSHRLLYSIALTPVQGGRFQPTGFPGLGAATYQTEGGTCLLVESAQSMANRLELTIWDETRNDLKPELQGLSHVVVKRHGAFLTDTILEAHRLNSPYLLEGSDKAFLYQLALALGMSLEVSFETKDKGKKATTKTTFTERTAFLDFMADQKNDGAKITIDTPLGAINRKRFADALLNLDVGSLLHGVFLVKKELAGGRLRVARALSAFIEADGVRVAASGGVKNDHVHPEKVKGDTKNLFGNIPFARDEFTAERITLFVNLDLAQIRGYGLGPDVERLLVLLALYKLRALLGGNLRLRTACDLKVADGTVTATSPLGFELPSLDALRPDLEAAIERCRGRMQVTEARFDDELKKGKDQDANQADTETDADQGE